MEFPELGQHCSEKTCNKLDFLPMKCDACDQIFCSEHFSYIQHSCSSVHRNDVQVPVCPLCGEPVPTPRNVSPDKTVGEHIDQYCRSETKKIFTNRCTFDNCKKKEIIPFQCSQCRQNFCLRHRHIADHKCKGPTDKKGLAAAEKRQRERGGRENVNLNSRSNNYIQKVQGNMSEDEALAKALAESIIELDESAERNRRSQRTATATVAATADSNTIGQKDKCSLS